MATINPFWKKWLIVILAPMLFLFVSWLLSGCTETKKLTKAENRVLANVESVKRVREKTNDLFPCSSDTFVSDIHDTTYITSPTKYIHHIDTLIKDGTKYIFRLDTAFFEKTRTITQTKIVTDNEKTNRQRDTINNLRIREAGKEGIILELRTQLSEARKQSGKRQTYFWILAIVAVLTHVGRSYLPNIKLPKLN